MIEKITPRYNNRVLFIVTIVTLFLSSQLFSQTTIIHQADFESEFGNSTDGRDDSIRNMFSDLGVTYSIYLQDISNVALSITENNDN